MAESIPEWALFLSNEENEMPKMMMGQIDHARSRVGAIKAELLGEAPKPPKQYKVEDLVDGLRTGEVQFTGSQMLQFANEWVDEYLDSRSPYHRPSFESKVLEYAFASERKTEETRYKAQREKYNALCHKVNAEATKVEDAIVLGDQHAALVALQEFAKFRP
jgi:hypothetical protein